MTAVISVILVGALITAGLLMNRQSNHGTGAPAPQAGEALLEGGSLEETYLAFEENFAALQEARKVQAVGMPDGKSAPPNQDEVVEKLETRDRQLRAAILRMSKGRS